MIKDFLKSIGINKAGVYDSNNSYVIDLDDSNEYAKYYTLLDKSELEQDDQATLMDINESYIVFNSDEYQVTLIADLEGDTYRIVVKEI